MATESTLKLVWENEIRGAGEVDNLSATMDDLRASIESLTGAMKEQGDAQEDNNDNNKKTRMSLSDVRAGLQLAQQAYQAVSAAVSATVTPTLELANQQRDLARSSGATAEESGVLIQAADDLGVSYETLTSASKKANAEGFSLNISTIKQLQGQYKALPDPVSRAQFAAEKFGKAAGPEMQKLLDASTEQLDALAESALESGLVLSNEAVAGARDFEVAQDSLNDAVEAGKVIIGQELIPVLTDLTELATTYLVPGIQKAVETWDAAKQSVETLSDITQIAGIKFQEMTGQIDANTAHAQMWVIATEDARLAAADTTAVLDAHERQVAALTVEVEANTLAEQENAAQLAEQSAAQDALSEVWRVAEQKLGDLNIGEAQRIELETQMQLLTGQLTAEELARNEAVGYLSKQLELGNITQEEYIAGLQRLAAESGAARDVINDTGAAIAALPNRDLYITYHINTTGEPPSAAAGDVGLGGDTDVVVTDTDTGQNYGGAQAEGGDYTVTRPTWFLAGEAGVPERALFVPQGRTAADVGARDMGNTSVVINVDARGAVDARAVEEAGYRGAKRALDESGVRADIRRRI